MMDLGSLLHRATACGLYRALPPQLPWAAVPLTRRADLVRDQLAHPPLGRRRLPVAEAPVRAGMTGSGDDLLVLAWSEPDLTLERRAGTRLLARLGVTPATAVANTLPGALAAPGSLLFGDVIEEYGALDVPLGTIESEAAARQAWELIDRVTPAVLCLEATTAARLFAAAPPAARPWLEGVVWLRRGAERNTMPAVPQALGFSGWQRQWLSVAEAASFVAWSCGAARFHADEGVIVEVADASSGACMPAGGAGTLVLTPRDGDAALLRYDSGVAARLLQERCACGIAGDVFELLP